ncbi:MAG: hypothetical protein AAF673_03225 [Pseudomonadota bacterium]
MKKVIVNDDLTMYFKKNRDPVVSIFIHTALQTPDDIKNITGQMQEDTLISPIPPQFHDMLAGSASPYHTEKDIIEIIFNKKQETNNILLLSSGFFILRNNTSKHLEFAVNSHTKQLKIFSSDSYKILLLTKSWKDSNGLNPEYFKYTIQSEASTEKGDLIIFENISNCCQLIDKLSKVTSDEAMDYYPELRNIIKTSKNDYVLKEFINDNLIEHYYQDGFEGYENIFDYIFHHANQIFGISKVNSGSLPDLAILNLIIAEADYDVNISGESSTADS